ncbi:unnamed protein product, partial [Meganyctiphanes norvegica]
VRSNSPKYARLYRLLNLKINQHGDLEKIKKSGSYNTKLETGELQHLQDKEKEICELQQQLQDKDTHVNALNQQLQEKEIEKDKHHQLHQAKQSENDESSLQLQNEKNKQ